LSHFDLKIDLKRMQLEHGVQRWLLKLAAPPAGSTFAAIGVWPADPAGSLDMEDATCGNCVSTSSAAAPEGSGGTCQRTSPPTAAPQRCQRSASSVSSDMEEATRGQSGSPRASVKVAGLRPPRCSF